MCDPTEFNPVCPACSRKVAVNNGTPVVVDRETMIDGVLYSKIVRKPVRCRDKKCMQRFIVSKLIEPVNTVDPTDKRLDNDNN